MRRLLALLTLPLLAAGCQLASAGSLPIPGPTSSVPVYAAAGAAQYGEAFWTRRRGDVLFVYFAGAYRAAEAGAFEGEPSAGIGAIGFVGRARCELRGRRDHLEGRCRGRGVGRRISPTQFEADPTLSSAVLRLRAAGYRHVVRWTGRGPLHPGAGQGAFFDPEYVEAGAGAGVARRATARGRIFGQIASRRALDFAYLAEGTGGFLLVEPELGAFDFRRTFRLPRRR